MVNTETCRGGYGKDFLFEGQCTERNPLGHKSGSRNAQEFFFDLYVLIDLGSGGGMALCPPLNPLVKDLWQCKNVIYEK